MTTQEYVDYVSQFNRLSIEDLLTIIKMKMRLSKKQQKALFLVVHYTLSKLLKANYNKINSK